MKEILNKYMASSVARELKEKSATGQKYRLVNNAGSVNSILMEALNQNDVPLQVAVLNDRDEAAYFYNDLLSFARDEELGFLPSSFKRKISPDETDNESILIRTECLTRLAKGELRMLVTYPAALAEMVVSEKTLNEMAYTLRPADVVKMSAIEKRLAMYEFQRSDFVYEPGQFSVRGSIIDIYSYAEENPIRLDFFGDEIESMRYFDLETQLTGDHASKITIVPDISRQEHAKTHTPITGYFEKAPLWWIKNGVYVRDRINTLRKDGDAQLLTTPEKLFEVIERGCVFEWGPDSFFRGEPIDVCCENQPVVSKHFELLADTLQTKQSNGYELFICSNNEKQIERIRDILKEKGYDIPFTYIPGTLHEGFADNCLKFCFYTEHQIFDRYHKYKLKNSKIRKGKESLSINEIQNLHPGDYVVHVDHGIGRFGGLVKLDNNGQQQEAIRLVYKNNSELYVGLHSLHKISKYKGKDGTPPNVNKLGGEAWSKLKQKTKSKVKDIAKELIALYAKRKNEEAFAFSHDSFLQEEMEASFSYEETPDQMRAIQEVKADMELPRVMDRLVCGDVGFGKTEVAIRAAFKAVADNKQVAILVPTTVLAYQHFNTFKKRLADMPCRVEYVSRMRKPAEIKKVLQGLKDGSIDIVIGTHRLTGKDVAFKDLGLLIIDEEQKFGVGVKEKLKHFKLNVDTLTMTATPIPRTLQFSLMGARDMSIIRTAPPNRYPIVTELHRFDEQIIKEAVMFELSRGGQLFFINNRVDTLKDIEGMLHRLVPEVKTCIAHGQMSGPDLETVMYGFMRGDYDVLIATTIIESGLDIPNANTIIINQAQNHGLSDLHQLRGRVGRSNRKAFCYLLTPPLDSVNTDAQRRLKAIEDFSGLGSGFNIAMQDLDIRGAGNILGAEQSGFITEIGYETYQKILTEALLELRDEDAEYASMSEATQEEQHYVTDCIVETDFEAIIPESYIENVSERIRLYRLLDNSNREEELEKFIFEIEDRFGKVPQQVTDLLQIVRMRRLCVGMGVERVLVKGGRMVLYFVANPQSKFYQSDLFMSILRFVQSQKVRCNMNEKNGKLTLVFDRVPSVHTMYKDIATMHEFVTRNDESGN
ncbi:MAG: transcription-repair coupling factor [Marinifilaceae bacterium]